MEKYIVTYRAFGHNNAEIGEGQIALEFSNGSFTAEHFLKVAENEAINDFLPRNPNTIRAIISSVFKL
jgi:hypothetical protein